MAMANNKARTIKATKHNKLPITFCKNGKVYYNIRCPKNHWGKNHPQLTSKTTTTNGKVVAGELSLVSISLLDILACLSFGPIRIFAEKSNRHFRISNSNGNSDSRPAPARVPIPFHFIQRGDASRAGAGVHPHPQQKQQNYLLDLIMLSRSFYHVCTQHYKTHSGNRT
jgi:hypothetical protein